MSRQELIAVNPCGDVPVCCPGSVPTCGCEHCAANKGFFASHEIERLVIKGEITQAEADYIDAKFNPKTGYLGPKGCRLPRKLRSFSCLSWTDCDYK